MPWLQLLIETDKQEAVQLEESLIQLGAVSVTLKEHIPEDQKEQPILEPPLHETPLWQHTQLIGLFDAAIDTQLVLKHLYQSHPNIIERCLWQPLEDKDWEREWMDAYQPIQVADSFWICPSWCEPPDKSAINLQLDPGLAFGTGTHPTTFLCMQWLTRQTLTGSRVIDYGCGSGILGVAALLLGAEQCFGVDIDSQALIATEANCERNGINQERFPVSLTDKHLSSVDVMVANILAGPLVELSDNILALLKSGGMICLSGILLEQSETVKNAYSNDIVFESQVEKDGWVCLFGQKT